VFLAINGLAWLAMTDAAFVNAAGDSVEE